MNVERLSDVGLIVGHLKILPLQLWLGSRLLYPPACKINTCTHLRSNLSDGRFRIVTFHWSSFPGCLASSRARMCKVDPPEPTRGPGGSATQRKGTFVGNKSIKSNMFGRHLGKLSSLLLKLQLRLVPDLLRGIACAHYHQVPERDPSLNQRSR